MKGDKKIIDILNDLLAGELTAVDQYLIHGEMYADMGFQSLADKAIHESEHLQTEIVETRRLCHADETFSKFLLKLGRSRRGS